MRIASSETDLSDRITVVVDRDAEPADLDEALADFLLRIVSKRCSAGAPATECRSEKPEQHKEPFHGNKNAV